MAAPIMADAGPGSKLVLPGFSVRVGAPQDGAPSPTGTEVRIRAVGANRPGRPDVGKTNLTEAAD